MTRKLFTFALAQLAAASAWAYDFKAGDLYYNITDESAKTVAVTYEVQGGSNNYTSLSETVTIPEIVSYNGTEYKVTSIGYMAFRNCSVIKQIIIGNSVTSIDNGAFYNSFALSQVTWNAINCIDFISYNNRPFADCPVTTFIFGEQVEHIPAYLCYGMDKLTGITIPNSVTSIGSSAFAGCSALKQINWDAINYPDFSGADQRPFADCPVTKVTFGSQVEHIPAYLCYGMSQFVSLSLPNSVTSIGAGAFGQSGIMSFVMPASITELGVDAFKDCNKLNAIVFGGNAAEWCGIDFKNEAANPIYNASENVKLFIDNKPVGMLVIPEGVTEIRNYAFNKASFLTFIDIPESVTAIGESAFAGCTALDSIYCRAAVPPTITATTFSETDYSIPLHIPAESFVQYLTADYWNAFTNQQAGLTQQLSYTVNYYVAGSNAYFSNRIAQGDTFRCYVTPAEGKNIVSITLNSTDITGQLGADGLLQIENITEDCTLIISTDAGQTTEATGTQQDAALFRAWQSNGEVFVEHTQDMASVALYDVNGRLLHQTGTNGYGVLRMVAPGKIHIVRATYADGTTASQKVM